VTQGNGGDGIDIYIPTLDATSEPVSLRFENCRALGDRGGALRIATGNTEKDAVRGSIEFVGCLFSGSKGAGIAVSGKPADGLKLRFESCTVADVALETPARSPIMLAAGADARRSIGGIEFAGCTIRDPLLRHPMDFIDSSGGIKVEKVTGKLILGRGGRRAEVPITDAVLAEWMPVLAFKAVASVKLDGLKLHPAKPIAPGAHNAPQARLRQVASYALYAEAGRAVGFTVRYRPVARYAGSAVPLVITDPAGKEMLRVDLPFEAETRVKCIAPQTGLYKMTCAPGANCVEIVDSTNPVSLSCESQPIPFYLSTGRFFFWVPEETKEFAVKVVGQDGGESVKATLTDPEGKTVESADNILRAHQFTVERAAGSPGGVWALLLERPSKGIMEDFRVDLRGVPPLLSGSAEAVLVTGR
jgi:hypothetical protein